MRIVYYTHTSFFETSLSLIRELCRHAEVHLLLEVAPTTWRSASFDVPPAPLGPGLFPADPILREHFPEAVRAYWRETDTFHLVVHTAGRSLHPQTWRLSRDVIRFVRAVRPDVFHIDDVDVSPRLAPALLDLRDVPVVISSHDPQPHSGERNWRKLLSRSLAYRRASRFVLHNRSLLEDFRRRHRAAGENVDVVHLGAYDILRSWLPDPTAPSSPTVLFFGRISPYKGLDLLYEAAPLVAARVPDVRFVVAGRPITGHQPPAPPTLAPPARLERFERYVSNADLARLFQEASLVVCPYRDATQSGILMTAYAFRKPVVATAVGGLPEYVKEEETGLLVPAGDAERLADAIARVLGDEALRERLARGIARECGAWLHWKRAASEMRGVYARAAGARAPSGEA